MRSKKKYFVRTSFQLPEYSVYVHTNIMNVENITKVRKKNSRSWRPSVIIFNRKNAEYVICRFTWSSISFYSILSILGIDFCLFCFMINLNKVRLECMLVVDPNRLKYLYTISMEAPATSSSFYRQSSTGCIFRLIGQLSFIT